jgi:hypothetical protein
MKELKCEFLMSYPNNPRDEMYTSEYENYIFIKIFSHYFQPGIWKKSLLNKICCLGTLLHENENEESFNISKDRNCFALYNTLHKNDMSTRSFFFPHMHALFKGKWTFFKYPCLKALVEAYGIDTSTRGIDTTWITNFQ